MAHMGERGSVYRVLVGTPDGQRPHGRPRSRREYNIKMDSQELAWRGMVWIGLPQDRDRWRALVNAIRNLRVP
jgi:hypothetical protein